MGWLAGWLAAAEAGWVGFSANDGDAERLMQVW